MAYLRSLNMFQEDFLEYLSTFHFTGDIYAIPEGTVVFPREPIVKVIAPVMEAQLVETAILNIINHQSLIATKAARVCYAARGDGVMEFGFAALRDLMQHLRRARGCDRRLCWNLQCSYRSDVPCSCSWYSCSQLDHEFPDEYTAFKTYAKIVP